MRRSHPVGVWRSAAQNPCAGAGVHLYLVPLRHHAPLTPTMRFAHRPGVELKRKLGGEL